MGNHQHVLDLDIKLTPPDVLRMMGCRAGGSVRPEFQTVIDRLLAEARPVLHPRGVYALRTVSRMTDTELALEGCPPIKGPISGFLKPARRIAVFVVTVGPDVEHLATQRLDAGQTLDGYVLNAIGSAAADRASDVIAEQIFWREAAPDEGITPPFSPGYCGMALEEQQTIFSIVDGSAVGVRLWPTMIMEPIKSVSGLVGIGDAELVVRHGIPCQWCELDSCKMRR